MVSASSRPSQWLRHRSTTPAENLEKAKVNFFEGGKVGPATDSPQIDHRPTRVTRWVCRQSLSSPGSMSLGRAFSVGQPTDLPRLRTPSPPLRSFINVQ